MIKRHDLVGKQFGKWRVEKFSHTNSSRSAYWHVICGCGSNNVVSAQSLKKGESTQCRACSSKLKTAIYNRSNKTKFIYVFKMREAYKIGVSDDIKKRFRDLRKQLPYPLEFILSGDNAVGLEKHLHQVFHPKQINGEWFMLEGKDVDFIKECIGTSCEI